MYFNRDIPITQAHAHRSSRDKELKALKETRVTMILETKSSEMSGIRKQVKLDKICKYVSR